MTACINRWSSDGGGLAGGGGGDALPSADAGAACAGMIGGMSQAKRATAGTAPCISIACSTPGTTVAPIKASSECSTSRTAIDSTSGRWSCWSAALIGGPLLWLRASCSTVKSIKLITASSVCISRTPDGMDDAIRAKETRSIAPSST